MGLRARAGRANPAILVALGYYRGCDCVIAQLVTGITSARLSLAEHPYIDRWAFVGRYSPHGRTTHPALWADPWTARRAVHGHSHAVGTYVYAAIATACALMIRHIATSLRLWPPPRSTAYTRPDGELKSKRIFMGE